MELHGCVAIPATAAQVVPAVRRARLVVIGGGTIFKGLHPSTGRRRNALLCSTAALVAAARLSSTPIAMVGVGAGELHGAVARGLARWIVRHTDLLVLRDEESAAVLAAAGVPTPFRIGSDPAWSLLNDPPTVPDPPAASNRSGDVVVAVSHLAGGPELTTRLAEALRPVAASHRVVLQPWQSSERTHADAAIAHDIAERLAGRAEVSSPPADLVAARAAYVGARLVIGMRFHALVAAAAAGAPFLAVAHEPKLAGLARRLDQPAMPPHAPLAVVTRSVAAALDARSPSPASVRAEMARAEEGFALLRLLASEGALEEPSEVNGLTLSDGEGCW